MRNGKATHSKPRYAPYAKVGREENRSRRHTDRVVPAILRHPSFFTRSKRIAGGTSQTVVSWAHSPAQAAKDWRIRRPHPVVRTLPAQLIGRYK